MELIDDFLPNGVTEHEDAEPSRTVMAVAALSNADIVLRHSENALCLLMLKNRKSGEFAVCSFDPARYMVVAPNYHASADLQARLYANPTKRGLSSLLDWTDRPTAVRRYADLVGEVSQSDRVASLLG